jgi:FkbM family methyltransferase
MKNTLKSKLKLSAEVIFNQSIKKYRFVKRLEYLIELQKINDFYDVGCNEGQFYLDLRAIFNRRITSVEPLAAAFEKMVELKKYRGDPHWEIVNIALGETPGFVTLNVSSGDGASSSVLNSNGRVEFTRSERVAVARFDDMFLDRLDSSPAVKIDVQGFEREVLKGMQTSLKKIKLLIVEAANVPFYTDAPRFAEIINILTGCNFEVAFIEHNIRELGRDIEYDIVFVNKGI